MMSTVDRIMKRCTDERMYKVISVGRDEFGKYFKVETIVKGKACAKALFLLNKGTCEAHGISNQVKNWYRKCKEK